MINRKEHLIKINGNNDLYYYQNQAGNNVRIKDACTYLSRRINCENNIIVVPDDMYSLGGIKFLIYAVINPYFKKLTANVLEHPIDNMSIIFKDRTYNHVFKFLIRRRGFYKDGGIVFIPSSIASKWSGHVFDILNLDFKEEKFIEHINFLSNPEILMLFILMACDGIRYNNNNILRYFNQIITPICDIVSPMGEEADKIFTNKNVEAIIQFNDYCNRTSQYYNYGWWARIMRGFQESISNNTIVCKYANTANFIKKLYKDDNGIFDTIFSTFRDIIGKYDELLKCLDNNLSEEAKNMIIESIRDKILAEVMKKI